MKQGTRKFKICSQIGKDIWGNASIRNKKIKFNPDNIKNNKYKSEYNNRLFTKQILKKYYGKINEKQFNNIYNNALRLSGKSSENLLILLERRLDSVVYRLNFGPTIFSARQLIIHGHILVNNKKVTIPSFLVKVGDVISIDTSMKSMVYNNMINYISICKNKLNFKPVPSYLEVNYKILSGILICTPLIYNIPYNTLIDVKKIIEFYNN